LIASLLQNELQKIIPKEEKTVALLLSGGVDSISAGFSLDAIGKRVHAYSFQLDDTPTSDTQKAEEVSRIRGWQFTLVKIPTKNLEKDFLKLIQLGCTLKTRVEATYPFLYLIPVIKEKYIVSALIADHYYGLTKRVILHFKYPKSEFDYVRNHAVKHYLKHKDFPQMMAQQAGKVMIDPYLCQEVLDYFLQFDWDEVNKPFQKHHVVRDYDADFQNVNIFKGNHQDYKVVSGISKLFEEKLLKSTLNFKHRIRILDLIRDYAKLRTQSR